MSGPTLGRVLIVDDDKKLTFILCAHLQANGFEAAQCHDGREAVELSKTFSPDVIVMDVAMPVMDGVEATRRIKTDAATKHIPVIMLTAKNKTEDLVVGLEAGAEEYVTKPFDVNQLLARVRTMIRLGNARRELDELNDHLTDQVQTKTRRLELLYEYARSLNEAGRCQDIYELVVRTVAEVTGSRRISLLLKEEDGEHLRCVEARGIDPSVASQIRIRAMHGVAGQVFTSGKTVAAQAFGPGANEDFRGRYNTEAFLSTPLISTSLVAQNETLGVLNVTEREDGQPFTQDEVDCIRSIADSAAIAIRNHQQTQRLKDSVGVLLLTVGRLAEYRDEETTDHLDRVANYARILAGELGDSPEFAKAVTPEFVADIHLAAPLHDIGKVGVPDDILTKPGKLTAEEYEVMKTHTEIGRQTLGFALARTGPVPMLNMCIDIACGHHEKYDGSGYPRGISGDQIPLAARIIALVDAYDAITSHRRYSAARSHEEAFEIVRAESGRHFDPDIVEAFQRCAEHFDEIRSAHWPGQPAAALAGA